METALDVVKNVLQQKVDKINEALREMEKVGRLKWWWKKVNGGNNPFVITDPAPVGRIPAFNPTYDERQMLLKGQLHAYTTALNLLNGKQEDEKVTMMNVFFGQF